MKSGSYRVKRTDEFPSGWQRLSTQKTAVKVLTLPGYIKLHTGIATWLKTSDNTILHVRNVVITLKTLPVHFFFKAFLTFKLNSKHKATDPL